MRCMNKVSRRVLEIIQSFNNGIMLDEVLENHIKTLIVWYMNFVSYCIVLLGIGEKFENL